MIQVVGKFNFTNDVQANKSRLRELLRSSPDAVYITEGQDVTSGEYWEGYAEDVRYGHPVVTKHNKKPYSFRKETDGTVRVF